MVCVHGTEGTTLTPSMSAIVIGMRLACAFNRLALVDSGATNNMRPGTASEAEQAVAVSVQLADGVGSLLQTPTGTLLCGSETQTILSLGQCIDVLRCKSMWTPEKGFILTHPKHGCINAKTDEGTPLIPEAVALSLIAEIEQKVINSIKTICTTEVVKSTQKPPNQSTHAAAGEVGKSSGSDTHAGHLGQDPEVKRLANSCMNIMAEAVNIKVDTNNLPQIRAAFVETVLLSEPRDLFKEIRFDSHVCGQGHGKCAHVRA